MSPDRWQRVEQLYRSALEREASERAAFLAEACAGDEGLRREVESLLGYQDQVESLMERPALELAARALAADKTQIVLGQQLGSYKILSLLGATEPDELRVLPDPVQERVAHKERVTGEAFTERAPPGPASRAIVVMRWMKSTARSRMTEHRNKIVESKRCPKINNSPSTG
jgi:hypothetical protein